MLHTTYKRRGEGTCVCAYMIKVSFDVTSRQSVCAAGHLVPECNASSLLRKAELVFAGVLVVLLCCWWYAS